MAIQVKIDVIAAGWETRSFRKLDIEQLGELRYADTKTIATSPTTLDFGSIATEGILVVENKDTTNYVDIGPDASGTMVPFGRILAGEGYVIRLCPGLTGKMQANTASVLVDLWLLEA